MFEYIGSGIITIKGKSLSIVSIYRTVFKTIKSLIDLIFVTPESTYSYYSSRLKGVI